MLSENFKIHILFFVLQVKLIFFFMQPQTVMFPGLHPMAMMSTTGITYPGRGGPTSYQPFAPTPYPPIYPSTIPPINPALAADVQV